MGAFRQPLSCGFLAQKIPSTGFSHFRVEGIRLGSLWQILYGSVQSTKRLLQYEKKYHQQKGHHQRGPDLMPFQVPESIL